LKDNLLTIIGRKSLEKLIEYNADFDYVKIEGFLTKTVPSGSVTVSQSKVDKN